MNNHFLNNIEYINFKCFKELKVNSLKRVNLISGKNNIGKTSFMEGLELYLSSKDVYSFMNSLSKMIRRRQYNVKQSNRYLEFDIIYLNSSKMEINSSLGKLEMEYFDEFVKKVDTQNRMVEYMDVPSIAQDSLFGEENLMVTHEPALKIAINGEVRVMPVERVMSERVGIIRRDSEFKVNINFVSSSTTEEKDIAIFYGKLVDLNKESYLDDSLKLFDENMVALKQKVTERYCFKASIKR